MRRPLSWPHVNSFLITFPTRATVYSDFMILSRQGCPSPPPYRHSSERRFGSSSVGGHMTLRKSIAVALIGILTQPAWTVAAGAQQGESFRSLGRPANQASRRDLRREHLLRSLFRDLSQGLESQRRTGVSRAARYTDGQRPERRAPDPQSESQHRQWRRRQQPVPAQSFAGVDRVAKPRLHAGAARVQQGSDGSVSARSRHCRQRRDEADRTDGDERHNDGVLRRQHGHRDVELRAAFRDERQLVRNRFRAVDGRRPQPDCRPDQRRLALGERHGRRDRRRAPIR